MIRNPGRILCLILVICLIAGIFAAVQVVGIPAGYQLVSLIQKRMISQALCGKVTVSTPDGVSFDAEYEFNRWMDKTFLSLATEGLSVYYQGGTLFLDNGRGFDFSWAVEPLPKWNDKMLWGLLIAGVQVDKQEMMRFYSFTLPESLLGDAGAMLGSCVLRFTEEAGQIIHVNAKSESGWTIDCSFDDTPPKGLPMHIRMASGGIPEDGQSLLPLLRGCLELASRKTVEMDVQLEVRCGSLPIRDSGKLLCDDSGLCLIRNGTKLDLPFSSGNGISFWMIGAGFLLCRDGQIRCLDDDSGTYSMRLPGEQLESVMFQVFPELEGLDIALAEATLELTVSDNTITDLAVNTPAQLPLLGTTIPLTVSICLHREP